MDKAGDVDTLIPMDTIMVCGIKSFVDHFYSTAQSLSIAYRTWLNQSCVIERLHFCILLMQIIKG